MKSEPIQIIFARKNGFISKWIQKVTWSRWSHCGIIDGDHVIESKGIPPLKFILVLFGIIENSTKLGGVVKTPISEFIDSYPEHKFAWIDGDIDIARKMVGVTMYDVFGVVGIWKKKRIDCDDKMTCAKVLWVTSTPLNDKFSYHSNSQHILNISRDTKSHQYTTIQPSNKP